MLSAPNSKAFRGYNTGNTYKNFRPRETVGATPFMSGNHGVGSYDPQVRIGRLVQLEGEVSVLNPKLVY